MVCVALVCVAMLCVAMVCVNGRLLSLSLSLCVHVCVCECVSMALMVSMESMVSALTAVVVVVIAVLVSVKNFVVGNFGRFAVCPSIRNFQCIRAQARKQRSVRTIARNTDHATIPQQHRHNACSATSQAITKHAVWPLHTLPPTSMYLS